MARFDYLEGKAKGEVKKKTRKATPAPDGRQFGEGGEKLEAVYIRKETLRAAWRIYKSEGGESVSELVENVLLQWLRERA